MTDEALKEAWANYFTSKQEGTPNKDIQKQLIEHYYPLVKKVANRMTMKLSEIQADELASMGVDGLYDAVSHYDPTFNTRFDTYAMHRIRGSMLDAIRKADWIPRLVRSNCAWVDKQTQIQESAAGRRLSRAEMAEKLGHSKEEFEDIIRSAATPAIHSVNDLIRDDEGKSMQIEHLEDSEAPQPLVDIMRKEYFQKLMGLNFTPQERTIMWLYYFDDRSMKEISQRVGLSESRVSQMHSMILHRLKQKAERNPAYFADIWALMPKFRGPAGVGT